MNRRKQTTPKQRGTPDKTVDGMTSSNDEPSANPVEVAKASLADQTSERTLVMSPDANRSSVSNDAVCGSVDKGGVLSHQEMPAITVSAAASLGQSAELPELASRSIPISQPDSVLEKDAKSGARRFQCDACGRLLSTSTSLERHMLTHTGQRPYPCPHCPICFTTNGNLIRHVKSCHETQQDSSPLAVALESSSRPSFVPETKLENSPFLFNLALPTVMQCSGSVNGSVDEDDRDQRAGSNVSEGDEKDSSKYKPFLCMLCDKVFSTRTNCERHIRNRHSESTYSRPELVKLIKFIPKNSADCHAICKYCKKDFVSQKMLKHHLRSPYSSCRRKPFACQLCEATFSTRNNCIRHISNLHPEHKSEYKKLIIHNAPMPADESFGDLDDDNSLPTMAILSPGVMSTFSNPHEQADEPKEQPMDSSEESISETYSPENYSIFSPATSYHSDRVPVNDALDLTMGPLDLSMKKRRGPEEIRSSPTSWFAREDHLLSKPVVPGSGGGSGKAKKMPLISVSSLMQERTVPMRMAVNSAVRENGLNNGGGGGGATKEVVERPAKRPRPYICQYCGIGFTIRGNMYRHFRHKHPEHVSKRRQKKPSHLNENSSKAIDDTLDSVVGESVLPSESHPYHMSGGNSAFYPPDEQFSDPEDNTVQDNYELDAEFDEPTSGHLQEGDDHEDREEYGEIKSESDGHDHLEMDSTASDGAKHRVNSYSMSPHVHACHECGRKFPWQSSLERHMYTHTGQKPYSCRWCPLKFSIKSNCERHCLRIHGKSFNNARKEKPQHGKTFSCPVCHETFAFKINCERHCLDAHQSRFEAIPSEEDRVEPVANPVKKRRRGGKASAVTLAAFPCGQCNAVLHTKSDLLLHETEIHAPGFDGNDGSHSSFSGSLVVDA